MLKVLTSSSGSQLTWGRMHSLLEADGGFPQPFTKEARHEPAPIWERDCHATLSPSVTAGHQSPPRYILDLENSLWKSFICYCCVAVWMCLWHLTHTLRLIAQLCFLINRERLPMLRFQMLGQIKDQWQCHKNPHQVTAQGTHPIKSGQRALTYNLMNKYSKGWWNACSQTILLKIKALQSRSLKISSLKLEIPLASRKRSVLPSAKHFSLLQHCSVTGLVGSCVCKFKSLLCLLINYFSIGLQIPACLTCCVYCNSSIPVTED